VKLLSTLDSVTSASSSLQAAVESLRSDLAQRDGELARLRRDVASRDKELERLRSRDIELGRDIESEHPERGDVIRASDVVRTAAADVSGKAAGIQGGPKQLARFFRTP